MSNYEERVDLLMFLPKRMGDPTIPVLFLLLPNRLSNRLSNRPFNLCWENSLQCFGWGIRTSLCLRTLRGKRAWIGGGKINDNAVEKNVSEKDFLSHFLSDGCLFLPFLMKETRERLLWYHWFWGYTQQTVWLHCIDRTSERRSQRGILVSFSCKNKEKCFCPFKGAFEGPKGR